MYQRKNTMEIRKYFKQNDNEDISNQKEIAKAMNRGKFILFNVYVRKGESLKNSKLLPQDDRKRRN